MQDRSINLLFHDLRTKKKRKHLSFFFIEKEPFSQRKKKRSMATTTGDLPMPTPGVDAAGDAAALAGALPVVDLRPVLDGVVDEGQASLESLAGDLAGKPDGER